MGIFLKAGESETTDQQFLVKRCPECFINLPLNARRCYSCKTRIGRVDRHGKAHKAVNWFSYVMCIVSWGVLLFYLEWAFF